MLTTTGHSLKKLRDRDETAQAQALADDSIGPLGILFCIGLIVATTFIVDYGVLPPPYRERMPAPVNVLARLDFQYNDPGESKRQRDEAAERAPRVYNEVPRWVDEKLKDLAELFDIVEVSKSINDAKDRSARFPSETLLVEELYRYNEARGPRSKYLTTVLLGRVRQSLQVVANEGILTDEDLKIERNKGGEIREIIRVPSLDPGRKVDAGRRVKVEDLNSVTIAADRMKRASWKEGLPQLLERHLDSHLLTRLDANLKLDTVAWNAQKDRARELVGVGDVEVKKGNVILTRDQPIERSDIERLHEENRKYKASLPLDVRIRHVTGIATVAMAVLMLFIFITSRIHEGIFQRRRALAMLGLFSIAALAGTKEIMLASYSAALSPVVFVAIVASLAFGQSVALLTVFALSILTAFAGIRWEAFPSEGVVPALPLAMMVGGVAAALPAEQLKDRRDLLWYAFMGGVVQFVLAAGMSQLGGHWQWSLFSAPSTAPLLQGIPSVLDSVLALFNGPICGLLVLGSLPLIETLFGILTNIRLFELADVNEPVLRRLRVEAPGTFTHTLQVQALAEPAAEAIGANTRLVSAGVLYHDIGKMLKPEYFVENGLDALDRHRRLRPSVSALLITAHVKDGIELAHEYGLPQQIIDFIPEHHGTTLVRYFYDTARKDAEAKDAAESVDESFFRYPGPKPQSRETAIVMLADTIDAATMTLKNPSAARMATFVHELIMDKMVDGQLDECDLTFAELAIVEQEFLRVLVTRFHTRIRYPGQGEEVTPEMEKSTTVVAAPTPSGPPTPGISVPTPAVIPATAPDAPRQLSVTDTQILGRETTASGRKAEE